ncbi:Thiol-specific monooxygenase [Tolypocladium ophioglossoides CBS 100239]|uniref:Thiol-specific monooxygenase n=1 Tax=Tolypocladium ophioglossoides (strain CBS 100239) TaxID=1163406 RepID=A0A0L0NIR1_TOLOC|nr:Thiol-specific monooxygenase [Tolypocladium ophioglossoides CBS 100239]
MGSLDPKTFQVSKVAVIGAGPCGLAAAKYLRAQGIFDSVVIFEQQDEVGGVWNYSKIAPGQYPVPQMNPFYPPEFPVQSPSHAAPTFPSAMYDRLHANIPGSLMQFSDQHFRKDSWVFPSREDIQEYLLKYAEDVRSLIKFCFQVKKISLEPKDGRDKWRLEAHSTLNNQAIDETFDAVVVANGHYSVPFIPGVKNITPFHEAHPSVITHSKHYRTADAFQDKKTIIVGNGPSGMDIALQINKVSKGKAVLSVRSPTPPSKLAHTGCEEVQEIEEFLMEQRGVRFKDGRVETDIGAIVYCTGFLFSYPFFLPDLQHKLITIGRGVHGLYKHLFNIQHPTLVFPALNMKSVPWPLSEAQAAIFSAVWSNNLQLPPVEEMERWSKELEEHEGEALHVFPQLGDGYYINELYDWTMKSKHVGKEPPRWDDELFWQRSVFVEAKLRFEQRGCKATTLDELGLHYDPNREK